MERGTATKFMPALVASSFTPLICEFSDRLPTEPLLQFEFWTYVPPPGRFFDSSIVDLSECAEIDANVVAAQWRASGLHLFRSDRAAL
jgi:hypothetical protein